MRVVVHDYVGYAFPAQLARTLAGRGHEVLHLHCGSFVAGKGRVEPAWDDPRGLEYARVDLAEAFAKYDIRRRIAHERETGRHLAQRVVQFRPDVLISANAPLFVQRRLLRACHEQGAAFVFWQQDVISAAARRVLERRSRMLGSLAGIAVARIERRLLRRSERVVVISEDFVPLLRRWGLRDDAVTVIENWAPLGELPRLERDNAWAREHGLTDETVFLYAGTLGFKHDPSVLLDLARWAGSHGAVAVVVSEGPGADWLAEHGRGEPALRCLPYQRYERLPEVLAAADVLVALLDHEAGTFSVPSKVLGYLCAGRPVLAAVPRENLAARVLERSGGGVVVAPHEREAFLAAAAELVRDADRRAALGAAARTYAESAFDVETISRSIESVLEAAVAARAAVSVRRGA